MPGTLFRPRIFRTRMCLAVQLKPNTSSSLISSVANFIPAGPRMPSDSFEELSLGINPAFPGIHIVLVNSARETRQIPAVRGSPRSNYQQRRNLKC